MPMPIFAACFQKIETHDIEKMIDAAVEKKIAQLGLSKKVSHEEIELEKKEVKEDTLS